MTKEFKDKFLSKTDESGRFIVTSKRTGRSYYVESFGPDRPANWGSYNPSTGDIENKKGFDKFRGSIDEKDSMISIENGFEKVHETGKGESPFSLIEELDSQYPDIN